MASTSLLLMRSLTFNKIDKIYTYLSPDIEYFHGRHLAYGIVAVLSTVSIVIGLPLLLSLEPFLNHKVNFTKIKPLLDQFQGCYKDKYRCFSGYYMICRLLIIIIFIVNSSNEYTASYALVIICGIIGLVHLLAKPYSKEILNKFDGVILHIIIFIAVLPFFDDLSSPLVVAMLSVLILLPLLIFIASALFVHKDDLKRVIKKLRFKHELPTATNVDTNNEVPMREFCQIVDDDARKDTTVTICDM